MVCLDARGLLCPEPIMKVREKMKEIRDGEVLKVTSDDPGMVKDLPAWCKCNGNKIIKFAETSGIFAFHIKKGG